VKNREGNTDIETEIVEQEADEIGGKRVDITEHLAELRARIIRSAFYLLAAATIVYNCYQPILRAFFRPLHKGLMEIAKHSHAVGQPFPPGALVFRDVTEPFMLTIQLSMIGGIIFAVPFITFELWKFIEPALTPKERRPFRLLAPFSVLLFLSGVALGYIVMPAAVTWFLGYMNNYDGAILLQDPMNFVVLFAKLMLAFGLLFQLPVLLVILGKFGIIRSSMMSKYWRHCTVVIVFLAAIISPSNDPFSMIALGAPLVVLFLLSIYLVKLVEPKD
jgi:sec-independent protein translocase protein TatC